MRLNIIGLDPSLVATGIVVISCNSKGRFKRLKKYDLIRPKGLKEAERLVYIRKKLLPILLGWDPIVVAFIENYAFGAKMKREELGEAGGIIRALLYDNGIPYETMPPATIKKIFTGYGRADKEDVAEKAIEISGCSFDKYTKSKTLIHNITDAFSVAWAGAKKYNLKEYIK